MTKMSREKFADAMDQLEELNANLDRSEWRSRVDATVPGDWRHVDADNPVAAPKTKLTIRLDADVAAWFRGQGDGYQSRVNAVLRLYMLAKQTGLR